MSVGEGSSNARADKTVQMHMPILACVSFICSITILGHLYSLLYLSLNYLTAQAPRICFFFMLNSAEHEIFSANKYENANNCWHFHIY